VRECAKWEREIMSKTKRKHAKTPEAQKYHLSYYAQSHPEGVTAEFFHDSEHKLGGCDAVFIASLLYPPDGSYSCYFLGLDGRTDTELPDKEWFKVWMMLSKRLSVSETLPEGRKELCKITYEALTKLIFGEEPDCLKKGFQKDERS
jgi:hypothetical protein